MYHSHTHLIVRAIRLGSLFYPRLYLQHLKECLTLNRPQSMLVEMNKGEIAFTSHFALKSIEMPAKI